jgi:hypothetical protein
MSHKLSLEIPTVLNNCIIKLFDTSVYSEGLPVTCATLHITAPGYNYSTELEFVAGSSRVITACDIQLQSTGCDDDLYALPDGIYIIKYSVSPNEVVYVEYNHLRITEALNRYSKILCSLELSACEPSEKTKKKLNSLRDARAYLDAAKAKVEYCHEPQKGMTLYNYAIKLLNKLDCKTC